MKFSTLSAPFQPIKHFVFNRPFTAFLLGAVLLLAFFFIRAALTPKTADTGINETIIPKQTGIFEIGRDAPTSTIIGTLDREQLSTIYATAPGIIGQFSVQEGSFVKRGSSIAHIAPSAAEKSRVLADRSLESIRDTRSIEQQILSLNKKISESETDSNRKEDLAKSTKKLGNENLDLKLLSAELNADIARSNEMNFTPFAPFDGTIEAIFVSPGDLVAPGTPIAAIKGLVSKSILRAEIPSSVALLIDPKGDHRVTLPSGETTAIALTHISASPTSPDSFQATFVLPDENAKLLGDNALLRITLALRNASSEIFIPLSAIEINRDTASVLVDHDGVATSTAITLGQAQGNFIEVTSGLSLGDRIILDRSVRPGDTIESK